MIAGKAVCLLFCQSLTLFSELLKALQIRDFTSQSLLAEQANQVQ